MTHPTTPADLAATKSLTAQRIAEIEAKAARQREAEEAGINLDGCPACSEALWDQSTAHPNVRVCKSCGAIYTARGAAIYLGDSYEIVSPRFETEDVPPEQAVYFDFATLGGAGLGRRHGWYNPATKLITQVG